MQRRLVVSYPPRNIRKYQSTLYNIPEERIPFLKRMAYSLYISGFYYYIIKQNADLGQKSFGRRANGRYY